jgi:hypothetical protein
MLVLVVVIFSLFLYEFGSNFPEKIYILQWAGGSECRPLMGRYPSGDECKWSSYYNLTADYWPLNKVYALNLHL